MLLNDAELSRAAMPPAPRERPPIIVDVAIIGAGIAGLWLANLLAGRGLAVALCDGNPVGGTQTAASQGIVHSGVKYGWRVRRTALTTMPARWRACLAGRGEVDLRGVDVAAEHVHLFGRGAAAKAKAALTGLVLAGGAKRVDAATVPPFGQGLLLELADFAVDVQSLIRGLAAPVRHRLLAAHVAPSDMALGPAGVEEVRVQGRALRASAYVFAAGAGNAALARHIGADAAAMRRSLRQTWLRLPGDPPRMFAHIVSGAFGGAPALTITRHAGGLYIGGHAAEVGAAETAGAHLARLRRLLAEHLPALDLTGAEFETFLIDRAEPADGPPGSGDAFVARHGNCLVCWPVKLTLAPRLGDQVLDALRHLRPIAGVWPGDAEAPLAYAAPPWAMAHADEEADMCRAGRRSGT